MRIHSDDEAKLVVSASSRLRILTDDFNQMKSTTLVEYDHNAFVIGRDMRYNPNVPEFVYNE